MVSADSERAACGSRLSGSGPLPRLKMIGARVCGVEDPRPGSHRRAKETSTTTSTTATAIPATGFHLKERTDSRSVFALLEMDQQQRYGGRRQTRDARGLSKSRRPCLAQRLARFVRQAAHVRVIEIAR